ncbi:hypothetical protein HanRHA438_Chr11g0530531 [Helianthus annuus]|nr:hypothetical protein HanRHA438_Chr11g0530531 [Helianthus annuus]
MVYEGLISARIKKYSCKDIIYEKSTCDYIVVPHCFLRIHSEDSCIGLLVFFRLPGILRAVAFNVPLLIATIASCVFDLFAIQGLVLLGLA